MRLLSLLFLSAFLAFAQLSADGVATSVTRTVTLTADQADFSVVAGAALGTTQQQITQILLDAGTFQPLALRHLPQPELRLLHQPAHHPNPGGLPVHLQRSRGRAEGRGQDHGDPAHQAARSAQGLPILRIPQCQPGHGGCHAPDSAAAAHLRCAEEGPDAGRGREPEAGSRQGRERFVLRQRILEFELDRHVVSSRAASTPTPAARERSTPSTPMSRSARRSRGIA